MVHGFVQNSPYLVPVLSQMNLIEILPPYFSCIIFNIILPSPWRICKKFLHLRYPNNSYFQLPFSFISDIQTTVIFNSHFPSSQISKQQLFSTPIFLHLRYPNNSYFQLPFSFISDIQTTVISNFHFPSSQISKQQLFPTPIFLHLRYPNNSYFQLPFSFI